MPAMRDALSATGRAPQAAADQHDLVRDRYRAYAPHYDRSYRRYTAWSRTIVLDAIADLPTPRRVLDVCCGTGAVTAAIADLMPHTEVIGVDLSQEMLGRAHARFRSLGIEGVRLHEAPAEKVPVESASVDLIICANAFHLFDRQESAMAEFARVLSPGGRAVILDWTRESLSMRALVAWLHLTQRTRRRLLTRSELSQMGRRAGLEPEVARLERIPPAWGLMTLRFLQRPAQ